MKTHPLSISQRILEKLEGLPQEKQKQILDYIEFIAIKYEEELTSQPSKGKKRTFGLNRGKMKMSDDFDEPLSPDDLFNL